MLGRRFPTPLSTSSRDTTLRCSSTKLRDLAGMAVLTRGSTYTEVKVKSAHVVHRDWKGVDYTTN